MKKEHRVRTSRWLLVCFSLAFGVLAHAVPGIEHRILPPHYASERVYLFAQDLEVQALGGKIRIERSWRDGQWIWNERWDGLEIIGGQRYEGGWEKPAAIRLARMSATGASSRGTGGSIYIGLRGSEDEDIIYKNLPYRTLIAYKGGRNGYRWMDARGNYNDYDPAGRMTRYGYANGTQVSFARDAQQRIQHVIDSTGTPLVTFTYEGDKLTRLTDYSGREVRYEYEGDRLVAVVDVLGKRWEYHYAAGLSGYSDPLGQRTQLSLAGDSLREVRHPDGRWTRYSYGYDSQNEEFRVRTQDESGQIVQRWHDRMGHVVRKEINGDLQFTRQFVLSDKSTDVRKIPEFFRLSSNVRTGTSGGSLSGISIDRDKPEQPEPPYVMRRIHTDARGVQTITHYDRNYQITRIQYPDGSEINRSYHPGTALLAEHIDERGIVTRYGYDGSRNLSSVVRAVGRPEQQSISYRWDNLNRLVEEVRAGDALTPESRWEYRVDARGNRTAIIDPFRNETIFTHDAIGNVLTVTNALDRTWTAERDLAGNLKSVTTPLGLVTRYTLDDLGQRTQVTLANQGEITIVPNAAGLPDSITDAANATTRFEYDAGMRLKAVVDGMGGRQEASYDNRGRLATYKDGLGNVTRMRFDNDRLAGIEYPTFAEDFDYDDLDQLKSQTRVYASEGGNRSETERLAYHADGLLKQHLDGNGNPTADDYDGVGQLATRTDAEGGVTQLAYDARGNLAQVTDPAGRITQFRYDARDALIAEIKPGDANTPRTERRYGYDDLGNLSRVISPDGRIILYSYDQDNRLVTARHYPNQSTEQGDQPERTTTYSYNALGRVESLEDGDTRLVYAHDAMGRVESIATTFKTASPPFTKTVGYSYDLAGRKASFTNAESVTYNYGYTAHGKLASVSIPGEGSISYQDYQWLQPQQILFPGGSAVRIYNDGLMRYSRRALQDVAGNTQRSWGYDYDAVGNITALRENGGQIDYGYDRLYRLTAAQYPEGDGRTNEAYAYDGVGNRLDAKINPEELDISHWQYNAHNQLVSHDGIGYRYNADGHLIEKGALQPDGSIAQGNGIDHWHYRYDSRERLVEVDKNGQLLARYTYNPLGQRSSKYLPQQGRTLYFLYSEEGLVAEYDAQGVLVQEYAYDPTSTWMTQPLFTRARRLDNGQWSLSYFAKSHLGTPEMAFEKSGEVTWQASTQAFGQTEIKAERIANNLRFPGQYFDAETGLHDNYFRVYDSQVGRYVESDPIGLQGGLNTYTYVKGNPLRFSDPYGLFVPSPQTPAGVAAGLLNTGGAVVVTAIESSGGDDAGDPWPQWKSDDFLAHPDKPEEKEAEDCPPDADCYTLGISIDILTRQLRFRRWDYQRLNSHGTMSSREAKNHQDKINNQREILRRLILEAKAKGCPYNPQADVEVTRSPKFPTKYYW